MCVCLSVCHCMCVSVSVFVCACLRRTACSGTGGLSGWIRQEPGAVLCTIRIKVAISGCYLLRDVLCSQFWWPLRPSPLNQAEMACAAAEWLGWDLFSRNWPVTLFQIVMFTTSITVRFHFCTLLQFFICVLTSSVISNRSVYNTDIHLTQFCPRDLNWDVRP